MSLQSTDPIADLLTRIRNAISVGKESVTVPSSKLKQRVLESLKQANYIADYKVIDDETRPVIEITTNGNITNIQRMSKPGRRLYVGADEIPRIKSGRGVVLVSTSKGIMTGDEAKKARLGGELLLKVY